MNKKKILINLCVIFSHRSNVVHHCRVKHKGSPINVVENDTEEPAQLDTKDVNTDEHVGSAHVKLEDKLGK